MAKSPAVILYNASGVAMAVQDGVAIPANTPGLLIMGSDGANSKYAKMAADGTLRIDPTGTTTQPVSAAALPLPAGASTLAEQQTQTTSLQLIDDIVHGLNGAFSKAAAVAGQLDDASTQVATEDNVAPVRITAQRALHANLRDTSGAEVGTAGAPVRTDPTGTTTQPISAASLPLPTGAATLAEQQTQTTSLQLIDDVVHATNGALGKSAAIAGQLDDAATTAAVEDAVAPVRITAQRSLHTNLRDASGAEIGTSGAPVRTDPTGTTTQPVSAAALPLPAGAATLAEQQTQTTSLQLIDDVVHATNGALSKAAAIAGQLDDTAPTAATEDNVAPVRITAQRALHSNLRNASGTEIGTASNPVRTDPTGTTRQPVMVQGPTGTTASVTADGAVNRLEILGKVQVTGASPPPATNPANIFASNPLSVGTHDTSFTIPSGQAYYLQEIVAGNEDPTKGAVVEVIFFDGTEHIIARVYIAGFTLSVGYPDRAVARDGTALSGNGTNTIIVRRTKFSGTNIAIDAVVRGYTV